MAAPLSKSYGFTVWLTGLPAAGKTTLARELCGALRSTGRRVEVLDGDEIRAVVNADLGFSREDRDENIRRIGFIARLLARNGVAVVVAAISPSAPVRGEVRASHESPFVEVFVECPLQVLEERDPKGLYRRARSGELTNLTGVSAPYDAPANPDVRVRTDKQSPVECRDAVLAKLRELRVM